MTFCYSVTDFVQHIHRKDGGTLAHSPRQLGAAPECALVFPRLVRKPNHAGAQNDGCCHLGEGQVSFVGL